MTNRTRTAALALGASLALTAGALTAAPADGAPAAARATPRLVAKLQPSGDPDGAGRAKLTFNKARGRVCATITWKRIDRPDAAHIHRRSDGGVVVDLTGSVTGGRKCTSGVRKALITRILRHPGRFYVNVHNADYPAGAIQGNLRRP